MNTYIETNSDGVIYVQIDEVIIGIVDSMTAISEDGIELNNSALVELERLSSLDEDFDDGTTTLSCDNANIVFSGSDVTVELF